MKSHEPSATGPISFWFAPQTLSVASGNVRRKVRQFPSRFAPILSQWSDHNLTQENNFYGFHLLDMLRDELDELEMTLSKGTHR